MTERFRRGQRLAEDVRPVVYRRNDLKRFLCGAEVVSKAFPEEKVGVIYNEDGKFTVLEYFEIPEDLRNKTKKGELVYRFGVTLNYLFKESTPLNISTRYENSDSYMSILGKILRVASN